MGLEGPIGRFFLSEAKKRELYSEEKKSIHKSLKEELSPLVNSGRGVFIAFSTDGGPSWMKKFVNEQRTKKKSKSARLMQKRKHRRNKKDKIRYEKREKQKSERTILDFIVQLPHRPKEQIDVCFHGLRNVVSHTLYEAPWYLVCPIGHGSIILEGIVEWAKRHDHSSVVCYGMGNVKTIDTSTANLIASSVTVNGRPSQRKIIAGRLDLRTVRFWCYRTFLRVLYFLVDQLGFDVATISGRGHWSYSEVATRRILLDEPSSSGSVRWSTFMDWLPREMEYKTFKLVSGQRKTCVGVKDFLTFCDMERAQVASFVERKELCLNGDIPRQRFLLPRLYWPEKYSESERGQDLIEWNVDASLLPQTSERRLTNVDDAYDPAWETDRGFDAHSVFTKFQQMDWRHWIDNTSVSPELCCLARMEGSICLVRGFETMDKTGMDKVVHGLFGNAHVPWLKADRFLVLNFPHRGEPDKGVGSRLYETVAKMSSKNIVDLCEQATQDVGVVVKRTLDHIVSTFNTLKHGLMEDEALLLTHPIFALPYDNGRPVMTPLPILTASYNYKDCCVILNSIIMYTFPNSLLTKTHEITERMCDDPSTDIPHEIMPDDETRSLADGEIKSQSDDETKSLDGRAKSKNRRILSIINDDAKSLETLTMIDKRIHRESMPTRAFADMEMSYCALEMQYKNMGNSPQDFANLGQDILSFVKRTPVLPQIHGLSGFFCIVHALMRSIPFHELEHFARHTDPDKHESPNFAKTFAIHSNFIQKSLLCIKALELKHTVLLRAIQMKRKMSLGRLMASIHGFWKLVMSSNNHWLDGIPTLKLPLHLITGMGLHIVDIEPPSTLEMKPCD